MIDKHTCNSSRHRQPLLTSREVTKVAKKPEKKVLAQRAGARLQIKRSGARAPQARQSKAGENAAIHHRAEPAPQSKISTIERSQPLKGAWPRVRKDCPLSSDCLRAPRPYLEGPKTLYASTCVEKQRREFEIFKLTLLFSSVSQE